MVEIVKVCNKGNYFITSSNKTSMFIFFYPIFFTVSLAKVDRPSLSPSATSSLVTTKNQSLSESSKVLVLPSFNLPFSITIPSFPLVPETP